jgi:hypothetical protein
VTSILDGDTRNLYIILVGRIHGKQPLVVSEEDWRITLRQILENENGRCAELVEGHGHYRGVYPKVSGLSR